MIARWSTWPSRWRRSDGPLSDADVGLGRRVADTLERLTGVAAAETGCGWVRAAQASREHHAWSAEPWTTRFGLPLPGHPAPLHPNAAGMRAVADLVAAQATGHLPRGPHNAEGI